MRMPHNFFLYLSLRWQPVTPCGKFYNRYFIDFFFLYQPILFFQVFLTLILKTTFTKDITFLMGPL